ncbi:MAG TPA: PxKF domain-containing protein [bacterium]|nr:PxKF domain-containing protein [bacterium]
MATKRSTSTSASCSPSPIFLNGSTTCTATVTDTDTPTFVTPTGTVTWTGGVGGTFSPVSCTLSGSGASATCSVTYTATTVGVHPIIAMYSGDANHFPSTSPAFSLPVLYKFTGFLPPVVYTDVPSPLNGANAGATVAMKWQLQDVFGNYVTSTSTVLAMSIFEIPCAGAPVGVLIDPFADPAGGSTLRYDSTANQFIFNWKSLKEWAGKCHQFRLFLNDGSEHYANFNWH